jgi:hypothetical protein
LLGYGGKDCTDAELRRTNKMIDRNKTKSVLHLALAAAIAVAPIAHAADDGHIQLAAAIGSERKPVTPPTTEKTPPKPAPAKTSEEPAFEGFETSTWIWIGVGAAAILAAAGGGGGGGGGGSAPPTSN